MAKVETAEYGDMMVRMVRAYGKRVSEGDDIDLARLSEFVKIAQDQLGFAARSQASIWSWDRVGAILGITRQAAFKRFGSKKK